jgi:2-dehydro-3-deoxygluconokinase
MKLSLIALGELLLRLSPPNNLRFSQANSFNIIYGGAEANVAAALGSWGVPSQLVTALPSNPIGNAAIQHLKKVDIGINHVVRKGERIGIYFVEQGASVRSTQVVYDRKGSSFAQVSKEDFDWDSILSSASWFHTSGITPGLSPVLAEQVVNAFVIARKKGLATSFDLNYRAQLWTRKAAKEVLEKILPYVDVCIGLDANMQDLLGISCNADEKDAPFYYLQEIQQRYGCKLVATSLREPISPMSIHWKGIAYDGSMRLTSSSYDLSIVDRIGTGDAFSAGLIYALMQKKTSQEALEFAAASGAWKHSVYGDHTLADLSEIESMVQGNRGGGIIR